jgi:SAM-dependent methyltransferase
VQDQQTAEGRKTLEERIAELGAVEPWVVPIRAGAPGVFTRPLGGKEHSSTLANKLSLVFGLVEAMVGPLAGKRLLDIGSNQGYASLEAVLRGASVLAIEPYGPNHDKTRFVLEANGALGTTAEVLRDTMEEVRLEKHGRFDAILFLGTIYHAEKPWELVREYARMTDVMVVETQLAVGPEINDPAEGYEFKAFEEGPGSALDQPTHNYLRQVRRTIVRVPTRRAVLAMLRDAGFSIVAHIAPTPTEGGELSGLYQRERGGIFLAAKRPLTKPLFCR